MEVTLQPGAAKPITARRDWSPIAQKPDRYGVMAHTPDPKAYHYDAGGRTIIPRATRAGGSRAFDAASNQVIMNIDPADPLTGRGGISVNMAEINREALKTAGQNEEDFTMAWAVATQQSQQQAQAAATQQSMRQAPPGYEGVYVTPQAFGTIHPSTQARQVSYPMGGHNAFNPADIRPATSPSVQIQGSNMPIPQPIPVPTYQLPQQTGQQPPVPQAQYETTQQPTQQWPSPVLPPQQPQYVPPQAQQPDMMAMMMQQMMQLSQAVQNLQRPQIAPPSAVPLQPQPIHLPPVPPYQQDAPISRRALAEPMDDEDDVSPVPPEIVPQARPQALQRALPDDCELGFLTVTPSRPRVRVVFDLEHGGIHSKHFHAVARRGVCLSLIFDNRYDGDRFIPRETEDGEYITVKLPERKGEDGKVIAAETFKVAVPNFHQTIGCMDILNLIIIPPENVIPSPREMLEELD